MMWKSKLTIDEIVGRYVDGEDLEQIAESVGEKTQHMAAYCWKAGVRDPRVDNSWVVK